jgi:hypothetical protein
MNIQLHPVLAREIARYVNNRTVAADMIATVVARADFKNDDFLFWRKEHIEATRALDAFGINLHTYDKPISEAFK